MSNQKSKKLMNERRRLLEELSSMSQLLHGSWVERYSTCSRETCKCHQGERHGPRHYLVVNENGRQRQKYIPNAEVEAALNGVRQYQRALEIIAEITRLNLELIKARKYGTVE